MHTKKLLLVMGFMLSMTLYITTSCSKSKSETCVHCTAQCGVDQQTKLDYCGEDAGQQETDFRNAHPDCEVSCHG